MIGRTGQADADNINQQPRIARNPADKGKACACHHRADGQKAWQRAPVSNIAKGRLNHGRHNILQQHNRRQLRIAKRKQLLELR